MPEQGGAALSTTELAAFAERWDALVLAWADRNGSAARDLLATALEGGLSGLDLRSPDRVPEVEDATRCAMALIDLTGTFDAEGYLWAFPHLARKGVDPLEHFCRDAWAWAVNPNRDFDVWWYTTEYLDPTDERVNAYVHYLLAGRFAGLLPLPRTPERVPTTYLAGQRVRRVCLFAAYDIDGIADDYVLHYLRELSRHADVYYLSDCYLPEDQLARLSEVTKGAWSIKHGRYDFGSYAMLARDLVGWDVIETYDELLLANDSCYLVRPLDEVFTRMDATACDWWGLQMTEQFFTEPAGTTVAPLPLDEAKQRYLPRGVIKSTEFAHVGSYFLSYRAPVIHDPGFRRRLDAVVQQMNKTLIIYKYEIGMTRYLVGQGFDFSTFVDDLYPFHPIYSRHTFELIEAGFPLLKRQFVADNPYDVPDLARWQERLRRLAPEAPVEIFARNMQRVMPHDRMQQSFAIHTREDGSVDRHAALTKREFRTLDAASPTFAHWWAFAVSSDEHTLADDERAVFEAVREDPSIKKIVLTRSLDVPVDGTNVVVAAMTSPEGQALLARSGHVFVAHSAEQDLLWPIDDERHRVMTRAENGSSPRRELVLRSDADLAADLRGDVERLRTAVAGRRLVLLIASDTTADAFAVADGVASLAGWLARNDAVLGIRTSRAEGSETWLARLGGVRPLVVPTRRFPDLEVLYRVADVVVSDSADRLEDAGLLGRRTVLIGDGGATSDGQLLDALEAEQTDPSPITCGPAAATAAWRAAHAVRAQYAEG